MGLDVNNPPSLRVVEKDAEGNSVEWYKDASAWFDVTIGGVPCRALYDVIYSVDKKNPQHTIITNSLREVTPSLKIKWDDDVTDKPNFIHAVLQRYDSQTGSWEKVGDYRNLREINNWTASFEAIPKLA